jgi:uncharacterized SAM-binding protein YcdF (DUF218 family)
VLMALVFLLAGLVALAGWLSTWPSNDRPARVDAVLVLAGGHGERERTGERLAHQGIAPVLVFSDGGRPGPRSERLCRQRIPGVRIFCMTPQASTTQSEARAFGELAAREGWRSVALVTTGYHVRRARLLVDRCYPGTVQPVGVTTGVNAFEVALRALREGVALVAALTVQRGC